MAKDLGLSRPTNLRLVNNFFFCLFCFCSEISLSNLGKRDRKEGYDIVCWKLVPLDSKIHFHATHSDLNPFSLTLSLHIFQYMMVFTNIFTTFLIRHDSYSTVNFWLWIRQSNLRVKDSSPLRYFQKKYIVLFNILKTCIKSCIQLFAGARKHASHLETSHSSSSSCWWSFSLLP